MSKESATTKPAAATPAKASAGTDTAQANIFNQTYYLFLILFVLHFFFSVYLFYKIKGIEKNGGAAVPIQGANDPSAAAPAPSTDIKVKKPSANEPWRGEENARYVLIEYSDYECPFCKSIHSDLKRLEEENTDVAWVFRDFPLSFHQKAQKMSEAAYCVRDLGGNEGYWAMADAIFGRMPGIEVSGLAALAGELGYDQAAVQQCLDNDTHEKLVNSNQSEGAAAGVVATPTTVIYDMKTDKQVKIEGALPYDGLKQKLDDIKAGNI
jgi:protein-disulfide isomerase